MTKHLSTRPAKRLMKPRRKQEHKYTDHMHLLALEVMCLKQRVLSRSSFDLGETFASGMLPHVGVAGQTARSTHTYLSRKLAVSPYPVRALSEALLHRSPHALCSLPTWPLFAEGVRRASPFFVQGFESLRKKVSTRLIAPHPRQPRHTPYKLHASPPLLPCCAGCTTLCAQLCAAAQSAQRRSYFRFSLPFEHSIIAVDDGLLDDVAAGERLASGLGCRAGRGGSAGGERGRGWRCEGRHIYQSQM